MRKFLPIILLLFCSVQFSLAQKKSIKGVVLDNAGPLPGASVIIKGTSIGVSTDFDGNYSLEAAIGDILVFSYVGYAAKEVVVSNQTTIDVILESNVLDEVIITAQGIQKDKKALGYAITKLDGEEVENRPEPDVARVLQGKISGVQITAASGSSGEVAAITVRSKISISESNSPLIVVNNVPFAGNLLDIDPNNIEDISVLKGLNASVLYGSEGRNGVILIQTKSGTSKIGQKSFSATASQTSYVNIISGLPDYQNKFGQGSDFNFIGGNVGTWGAAYGSIDQVPHPYSGFSQFPEFDGVMIPFQPKKNNVKDFFKTGRGTTTSLNISTSQETTSFNLSAAYTHEEGIIGDNDLKRFNIGLGGAMQVTEKLKVNATLNYSNRQRNAFDEDELFDRLLYIPRSMDVFNLPYQDSQGRNVYYRGDLNPNWLLNNTNRFDDVNRVFGTLNTNYKFNDNIGLTYRIGYDIENRQDMNTSNKGGIDDFEFGFLNIFERKDVVIDQAFIFNLNYDLTENIGFDAQIGANSNLTKGRLSESENTNQIVYGFFRPSNFTVQRTDYREMDVNLAGVFAQLGFSYKNYLYLNLSGRNDWGSTVEVANQSLFYPGVSMSFIPTSAFNIKSDIVNYLKLRGAYATSSGYPDVYNTRQTLSSEPIRFVSPNGNIISNSIGNSLANFDLRPELHREIEVGLEAKLFKNRVTLEASAYKRISEDQILEADLPPEVGFGSTRINAGRIDSEGIEIDLGVDVIKNNHFSWNMRNLFTAYETEVIDLPFGMVSLPGSGWAIEGKPFGVIRGDYALRDHEGNFLINPETGELLTSDDIGAEDKIIADPTPDWTITNINTIRYKNFSLSAQLEYTHGGESESDLAEDLLERGVTRDTENREGAFILKGVYADPATGLPYLDDNGNTIPNTTQIVADEVAFNNFYNANDNFVFDTSVFRIREVSLGYMLDKKQLKNLPFESLNISLSGRNLFYHAPGFPKYTNIDPELDTSDGDTRTPTTTRYSLSLVFKF